jgi:sodium/potassium/calcium exchanger 6
MYAGGVGICAAGMLAFLFRFISLERMAPFLSFAGFAMSVIWIYVISSEIVSLLQTFGLVFGVSETILGLTVFAFGNSLLDLLNNLGMAKLGLSVMAIGASYGSPMMNIVMGIGVSTLILMSRSSSNGSLFQQSYVLESVSRELYISIGSLLFTLLFSILYMIKFKFEADARFGMILIFFYCVLTVVQLILVQQSHV